MSQSFDRLPALPLIVNDPYFSIWCAADRLTDAPTTHWAGAVKPLDGAAVIDGKAWRFLGAGREPAMETVSLAVTPTATRSALAAAGVEVTIAFTTPLLLDRPDILSMPVTYVDVSARSTDGKAHEVSLCFRMSDALCYELRDFPADPERREATTDPGYLCAQRPAMLRDSYAVNGLNVAFTGRAHQGVVGHSGDGIAIDWGYLYLAGEGEVAAEETALVGRASGTVTPEEPLCMSLYAAYDDIASINYFGRVTPAWYARDGKTILDAIETFHTRRAELLGACAALDKELMDKAFARGGEDYRLIVCAAYRHAIGAHKLIADENGDMVFLSKENNSNGCIGTVDVSYPSIPLFLLYNPEFVRGMCRPILKFASLPVWTYDFAPHDAGRYPHATGQVYGLKTRGYERRMHGLVYPPIYMYPASADIFDLRGQMPVEECGNMLLMLCAASRADGDWSLEAKYMPLLDKWVRYLIDFGEDPGEQLCTDDFAGHLAHNINLSAKAVCGVAAYALIRRGLGDEAACEEYMDKARAMAKSWLERASAGDYTYLTFEKVGWSMKYNMVWDKLLGLHLLDDGFYEKETKSYLARQNEFGLPLDSRSDYTKSDWILWSASMADGETFRALVKPVAHYLRKSESRVAFSDWYFTSTGKYRAFIARSVQGGLFMPLLMDKWTGKA
ncbi:MAG: DUF4965 domain-containing protein [Clostridia bacterium]|nr:DUF4965 domain-containing protein [Clostridia bacterium]